MLIKSETHASYYEEQFYYNIDLETGKELTLLDLLGPDFKAIVNQSVKDQMKQRMQADPDAYYFEDDLAFTTISDDQAFMSMKPGMWWSYSRNMRLRPAIWAFKSLKLRNKGEPLWYSAAFCFCFIFAGSAGGLFHRSPQGEKCCIASF